MTWWKVVRIFVNLKLNYHNEIITICLFTNTCLQLIWTKLVMLLHKDVIKVCVHLNNITWLLKCVFGY